MQDPVDGKKLNKYAANSFNLMKATAANDGVNLKIHNSDRTKESAEENCKNANNPAAVACFPNSHNLGLAVDLYMSVGNQKFTELGATMPNTVNMFQSPIHKWLFLNAAKYGWYPYTPEPWHWEYNPTPEQSSKLWSTDFRTKFLEGAPSPP